MPTQVLFDDFDDNSENGAKWNYAGTHAEEGGKQRVGKSGGSGSDGSARNEGKAPANVGWEWQQEWDAGGSEGPDVYGRFVSGDGWVEARSQHAVNSTLVSAGGGFSGYSSGFSGKSVTIKVVQEQGVVKLYVNGNFVATLKSSPFTDTHPYFENVSEGGDGSNFKNMVSVLYYYAPELAGGGIMPLLD